MAESKPTPAVYTYRDDGDSAGLFSGSVEAADRCQFVERSEFAALEAQNAQLQRDRDHFQACWNSVAGVVAQNAELVTDLKAAFYELGGIGNEASLELHRIGIDSARGILGRAIAKVRP